MSNATSHLKQLNIQLNKAIYTADEINAVLDSAESANNIDLDQNWSSGATALVFTDMSVIVCRANDITVTRT